MAKDETNVSATKVYFPDEKSIKVHQNQVQICPFNFPAGYYWYGKKRASPGRPPKWVEQLLTSKETEHDHDDDATVDPCGDDHQDEEDATVDPCDEDHRDKDDRTEPVQRSQTRVIKPPARYL